jgi:hypothetical protein
MHLILDLQLVFISFIQIDNLFIYIHFVIIILDFMKFASSFRVPHPLHLWRLDTVIFLQLLTKIEN